MIEYLSKCYLYGEQNGTKIKLKLLEKQRSLILAERREWYFVGCNVTLSEVDVL